MEILKQNPWDSFFPAIATGGVFAVVMIVLAACDLNRELAADSEKIGRVLSAQKHSISPRPRLRG
jgi:hypothetical protein